MYTIRLIKFIAKAIGDGYDFVAVKGVTILNTCVCKLNKGHVSCKPNSVLCGVHACLHASISVSLPVSLPVSYACNSLCLSLSLYLSTLH